MVKHNLLQDNKLDICPINHVKIGSRDNIGHGPTIIPDTENNTLKNILFIKYKNTSIAYNLPLLIEYIERTINETNPYFRIPHLNKKIHAVNFLNKIEEINPEDFCKFDAPKVISLTDNNFKN